MDSACNAGCGKVASAVWIEKGHMRMLGDAQEVCAAYRQLGQ